MVEIVRAQNEKEWEDIEGVVVKNGKADAGPSFSHLSTHFVPDPSLSPLKKKRSNRAKLFEDTVSIRIERYRPFSIPSVRLLFLFL